MHAQAAATPPSSSRQTGTSTSWSLVLDSLEQCSYLPDRPSRLPLWMPSGQLAPEEFDQLLAAGFRRSGMFAYRTQCPGCQACEPTRLPVGKFRLSRSLRRVLQRGDRECEIRWSRPSCDPVRLRLFNQHGEQRGLSDQRPPTTSQEYNAFLRATFCQTLELSVWLDSQLVAIAITDMGAQAASAVYTYFDPQAARFSLGTYAILKQWQWCQQRQLKFLYLGLYVADNQHLRYKARFVPQQRLIDGQWQGFDFAEYQP